MLRFSDCVGDHDVAHQLRPYGLRHVEQVGEHSGQLVADRTGCPESAKLRFILIASAQGLASIHPTSPRNAPSPYCGPTVVGQSTELLPSQLSISFRVTPKSAGSVAKRAPSTVVIEMKLALLLVHWLFVIVHFR
jgi:hypothetical protein